MDNLRFLVLALALGAASFFGVRWYVQPGRSALPSFHRVATDGSRAEVAAATPADDDDDAERAALRQSVLDAATDMIKDPCDTGNKFRYVQAATDYAQAWLKLAPCVATNTCSNATSSQLDHAQKAFGTAEDRKVRVAMADVHGTGAIQGSDFPPSTLSLMASLANDSSLMSSTADAKERIARGEILEFHFHHVSRCGNN